MPADRGTRAELLAYHALTLSLLDQPQEAASYITEAVGLSRSTEPRVVTALATVVLAFNRNSPAEDELWVATSLVGIDRFRRPDGDAPAGLP